MEVRWAKELAFCQRNKPYWCGPTPIKRCEPLSLSDAPHYSADPAKACDHQHPGLGIRDSAGSYRGDGIAHLSVETLEDEIIVEVGAVGLDVTTRLCGHKIRHGEIDILDPLVAKTEDCSGNQTLESLRACRGGLPKT